MQNEIIKIRYEHELERLQNIKVRLLSLEPFFKTIGLINLSKHYKNIIQEIDATEVHLKDELSGGN